MNLLLASALLLTAAAGAAVVFNRDPRRQVFALTANGLVLAILFLVLQAPDVALSEIVVGAVVVPLLYFVTLMSVRCERRRDP